MLLFISDACNVCVNPYASTFEGDSVALCEIILVRLFNCRASNSIVIGSEDLQMIKSRSHSLQVSDSALYYFYRIFIIIYLPDVMLG
jgi:hypothetical protein